MPAATPVASSLPVRPDAAAVASMRERVASVAADPRPHIELLPKRLSPSRLADFLQCPRLFYFRVICRLSSPPTFATAVGTLTHAVLEHLFDAPPEERTLPQALAQIPEQWTRLTVVPPAPQGPEDGSRARERAERNAAAYRDLAPAGSAAESELLDRAVEMVRGWFAMEKVANIDPTQVPLPSGGTLDGREVAVGAPIGGVYVHGSIDRVDQWDGQTGPTYAISDYKTGKVPGAGKDYPAHVRERISWDAFRQLRIYALLMWKVHQVPVRLLRMVYVATGDRATGIKTETVTAESMRRTELELSRSWAKITAAARAGSWEPQPGVLCSWCYFQEICPAITSTGTRL